MKRQNWLPLGLISLVVGLALVWGCSDDKSPTDPGGGGGSAAFGTISGVVHGVGGSPLAEVMVTVGNVTRTSNEEGFFVLTSVPLGTPLVSIATTGYASTFRVVTVIEGGSTHLSDIVLVPLESFVIGGAAGGTVSTTDGVGQVEFGAASFVDGAGNAYNGAVTVALNAMQPEDSDFYGAFPGAFNGIREDDTEVPFISFGFMTVEITGADKAPLVMAPGSTAALSLTINPDKVATAPATIPMWYFDETDGLWHEEGEATLNGNVYETDVAHFTSWNWDLPVEDISNITGTVVNQEDEPVVGARVISHNVDAAIMDEVFTDASGAFTVRAVCNSNTEVWAVSGSLASEPVLVSLADVCPFPLTQPLVLTVPAYSISLTWGEVPEDLDSHLLIPMTWDAEYDYYHICWFSIGDPVDNPYAFLDTDDTVSYGPEIITGTRVYNGRFQYWVHNFETDSTTDLRTSGAVVQLEIGGRLYLYRVSDVPTSGADPNGWWHVFDFVVTGTGTTGVTVEPVMRFQAEFSNTGVYPLDKAATGKK